jgi:hypothetical protein
VLGAAGLINDRRGPSIAARSHRRAAPKCSIHSIRGFRLIRMNPLRSWSLIGAVEHAQMSMQHRVTEKRVRARGSARLDKNELREFLTRFAVTHCRTAAYRLDGWAGLACC